MYIDTDKSEWPTDESNEMTISIPSDPSQLQNWNSNTKTIEHIDLEESSLVTYNEDSNLNYATSVNIDLSKYKDYSIIDQSNQWRTITQTTGQLTLADLFINYDATANQVFTPNNTLTIQVSPIIQIQKPVIKFIKLSELDGSYSNTINLNQFNRSTGTYNYYGSDVNIVFGLDVARVFFGYNTSTGSYNYGHHVLWYSISHTNYATPQVLYFLDENQNELFRTSIESDQITQINRAICFLNKSFDIECGNTTYNNYWKNNTG